MDNKKIFKTTFLIFFFIFFITGLSARTDLRIKIRKCPGKAYAGQELGDSFNVYVKNVGKTALKNVAVDLVLSSNPNVPYPLNFAVYSPNFSDDVLLKGGREHIPFLAAGAKVKVKLNGTNQIPTDTPTGLYYLAAVVDPGDAVKEVNERNNVALCRLKVKGQMVAQEGKLPDLGMYGFLKIGKNKRQVKWNKTIVLTPDDALLNPNGKPAFDLFYSYREFQKVAAANFKNKIFFNGKLVSQQTNLSLAPFQIKDIHTQAYLGPENGKLQIKIDADNEVKESREDNNFHFFVNLQFKGFGEEKPYKPCGISLRALSKSSGYAGDSFKMIGKWGPVQGTKIPCINMGKMNKLIVEKWTSSVLYVKIPAGLKPGKYRVGVYCNDLSLGGSYSSGWKDFEVLAKLVAIRPGVVGHVRPIVVKEDCIPFDPAKTEVKEINGRWKIVQGNMWMYDFGSNRAEALKALRIIKYYKMDSQCFVGRPDASFEYLKVGGSAPAGPYSAEDCTSFNPATIEVKNFDGRWKIVDGSHWMFDFGSNETEARQALSIIKKYGFTKSCFVGRPGPSFKYLRK